MSLDVVVAEDEEAIGFIIKTALEKSGLNIVWEQDGKKAMDTIQRDAPKAVVLDLMMPVMSGFEVLQTLKSDPDTSGIPVLILSARTQQSDVKRALALGAKDYLIKPFLPSVLVERVQWLLAQG